MKNYDIDIVIPTFKRGLKLATCLNSIPIEDRYHVWVYFDNNDYETARIIDEEYGFVNITVMDKQYRAFGIWNYHLEHMFNSDIMVYLCDDTELHEDTLENVEKHFKEKFPDTDGVVTFSQSNIEGSDSAMGCIGSVFTDRYPKNQVFCPNFKTFYADTELGDYAKELNKFHYGEDCKINHYHPAFYKNADEAHNAIRDEEKNIDVKVNKFRKEKGYLWGKNFNLVDRDKV